MKKTRWNLQTLTGAGVLAAIVILLQAVVGSLPIGPSFTVTIALVPIVIGAVLYGPGVGAVLGGVFGAVVCIQVVTGAAGASSTMMLEFNPAATMLACMIKGIAAGLLAGFAAKFFGKKHPWGGVLAAAIAAPAANTGIFSIALATVFGEIAKQWAGSTTVLNFILTGIIGFNFLIELAVNIILAPAILRIIRAVRNGR